VIVALTVHLLLMVHYKYFCILFLFFFFVGRWGYIKLTKHLRLIFKCVNDGIVLWCHHPEMKMCVSNEPLLGEISGSHGDEYEDGCLLGC
jgi:hypothetical protein